MSIYNKLKTTMNRFAILLVSVIGMFACFTTVHASTAIDEVKPFVGKWGFWEDPCSFELELDLYGESTEGIYGLYQDFCDDTSMEYRIIEVLSVQGNAAEVMVENGYGKKKVRLSYDAASGRISFIHPDFTSPIVFKRQDKFGFVCISRGDKVNVRATPVSGTPLLKADFASNFKFLGKEKGWFKVQLSATDKRVGYISPEYASYLKDNRIPDEAFEKDYARNGTSIMFIKKGDQIMMTKETMRPLPDGSFLPALLESYLGRIEGNAVIFTYCQGGYTDTFDAKEMTKIEPYVIYFWKNLSSFIVEGKNFMKQ